MTRPICLDILDNAQAINPDIGKLLACKRQLDSLGKCAASWIEESATDGPGNSFPPFEQVAWSLNSATEQYNEKWAGFA